MGFKFVKRSETASEFHATANGDDQKEFLLCVQRSLKELLLDVTVDFTENPKGLGRILTDLLNLQKVLQTQSHIVTLRGLLGPHAGTGMSSTSPFMEHLKALGFKVILEPVEAEIAQKPPPPPLDQSVVAQENAVQDKPPVIPVVPVSSEAAPDPASVNGSLPQRLNQLREALAQALSEKRVLEREEKSYRERLSSLGLKTEAIDQKKLQALSQLEKELEKFRQQRGRVQHEIDEVEKKRVEQAEKFKKELEPIQAQFRKDKDQFDKKIADVAKKHEKLVTDFKKKSDARREKLEKALAKKNDGSSGGGSGGGGAGSPGGAGGATPPATGAASAGS